MDPHDTTFLLDQFLISQTLVSVPFVLVTEEIMLYCMQKTHFHIVPSLPSSFRLIPFSSVFLSPVCSFVFGANTRKDCTYLIYMSKVCSFFI